MCVAQSRWSARGRWWVHAKLRAIARRQAGSERMVCRERRYDRDAPIVTAIVLDLKANLGTNICVAMRAHI